MYKVIVKKKILRNIEKMPVPIQKKLQFLVLDLAKKGPERYEYQNYSKPGPDRYHCHLSYKWIACWQNKKNSIIIEVYYAGSRENAPY